MKTVQLNEPDRSAKSTLKYGLPFEAVLGEIRRTIRMLEKGRPFPASGDLSSRIVESGEVDSGFFMRFHELGVGFEIGMGGIAHDSVEHRFGRKDVGSRPGKGVQAAEGVPFAPGADRIAQ